MQKKIAKRVNDLVSESVMNGKRAAIDYRSGRSGRDRCYVANIASNFVEEEAAFYDRSTKPHNFDFEMRKIDKSTLRLLMKWKIPVRYIAFPTKIFDAFVLNYVILRFGCRFRPSASVQEFPFISNF